MMINDKALLSEISAFEDQRYDAMMRADVGYLSAVFDDGLIYTHGSGKRQAGADYLRGLAAGDDVYRKISYWHRPDRTACVQPAGLRLGANGRGKRRRPA